MARNTTKGSTKPATTPTAAAATTPPTGPVVVAATAKAVARVQAAVTKTGATDWAPTRNALATLQALKALGAVSHATAVPHTAIAGRTGRKKGNQCRELSAAGYVSQWDGAANGGHLFALTPAGQDLVG